MTKSKRLGTDGENKVVAYAKSRGYQASRKPLKGRYDEGDVSLGDGIAFTIEVKAGQGALNRPHDHLKELRAEMVNDGTRFGCVIAKKKGSTKVGEDWVMLMPVDVGFDMIDAMVTAGLLVPDGTG